MKKGRKAMKRKALRLETSQMSRRKEAKVTRTA